MQVVHQEGGLFLVYRIVIMCDIINLYVGEIMEVLITAAKQTIPPKRFIPHRKPGWNKPLKAAHTKSNGSRLDNLITVTTQLEGSIKRPSPHLGPA